MRTTVTLDADAAQLIEQRMRECQLSFDRALNDLVRVGARVLAERPFRTNTAELAEGSVNLDQALQVVSDHEDVELFRRLRRGE